jgi:protein TonB
VNQPPPPPRTAPPVPSAKRAPSPARAGRILAASPSAVADLPATSFVTGTAATYAGGVTTATGKSDTAVTGPVDPGGGPGGPGDRSSPVEVQDTDWKCPWPREAETQQIDEQTVTIRVVVRADGSVESATALSDPGFGFAAAARACALAARYAPARDRSGRPVRAASPPILVHFSR